MAQKEIAEYLRSLNIKQVRFGGFDQTQVFDHLKKLTDMYEEIIEKQKSEYEAKLSEYEVKLTAKEEEAEGAKAEEVAPEIVEPVEEEETAPEIAEDSLQKQYEAKLSELTEAIDYIGKRKVQIEEEGNKEKERIIGDARVELTVIQKEKELIESQAEALRVQKSEDERKLQEVADAVSKMEEKREQVYQSLSEIQNRLKEVLSGDYV